MKRYDLVKLTNATAYKNFGLVDGMHGIAVDFCEGYFNDLYNQTSDYSEKRQRGQSKTTDYIGGFTL